MRRLLLLLAAVLLASAVAPNEASACGPPIRRSDAEVSVMPACVQANIAARLRLAILSVEVQPVAAANPARVRNCVVSARVVGVDGSSPIPAGALVTGIASCWAGGTNHGSSDYDISELQPGRNIFVRYVQFARTGPGRILRIAEPSA